MNSHNILSSPTLSPTLHFPSSSSLRSKRKSPSLTDISNNTPLSNNNKPPSPHTDPFAFIDEDEENDSSTDEEGINLSESSGEEETEKKEEKNDNWSEEAKEFIPNKFNLISSLSRSTHHCSSPSDFFRLFLTFDIIHMIVKATNKYGNNIFKENWEDTNEKEIYSFFSALIFMGIYKFPSLQSYWSHDTGAPFLTQLFNNGKRFLKLHRSFYINNGERNVNDILWHVRPLYEHLKFKFSSLYTPSQILTIDESMVPCKARSSMKQYIKSKHHRWGYKIWCIVNENYLLNFSIYEGKKGIKNASSPSEAAKQLIIPYYNLNHLIVMDNLFSSITLCEELLQHSTYLLSTLNPNRKLFPPSLSKNNKNLHRYEYIYQQKNNIVIYLFYDCKPVYILSSFHHPNLISTISRHEKSGNKINVSVPTALRDYNLYRGEVDTIDQMESYYSICRKSKRWWPRLAYWLIDMCINNAWRLYQKQIDPKISLLHFRIKLMHELAGNNNNNNNGNNSNTCTYIACKNDGHHLIRNDNKRDCYVCSDRNKNRVQTHFMCAPCNKYVCVLECYDIHRVEDRR